MKERNKRGQTDGKLEEERSRKKRSKKKMEVREKIEMQERKFL